MSWKLYSKWTLLMSLLFIGSLILLGIKIMNPSEVHIIVEEGNPIVEEVYSSYTKADVLQITLISFILGVSGSYLSITERNDVNAGELILEERQNQWQKIAVTLKEDEQILYQAVLDKDGIVPQSDLVELTGLSKTKVSRVLDLLESRGLVERKRRGMRNIIYLM